ncbi:hypothetical protein JOQ06_024710 [Pogonophryne albipinna]|uniref:E2F/DP family winged-helix DNA-binding domain-containing protein n=1 Tax=Pogonophryne albipinna TaxID=1090488 RepID=A0AAD6A6T4_9TELE|nr:hypothetical protein JOQ06_024710 [Pogonophryne albipinna]
MVKRRLELEAGETQDLQDGDRTSKSKQLVAPLSQTPGKAPSASPIARRSICEKSRFETSLGLLTRRFADIMRRSHDGVVDLNFVANELNAPKRRLYDVTNVLEGIKLIKKKGGEVNSAADVELKDLVEQERILDELILSCRRQVHRLYEDQSPLYSLTLRTTFAYLTYEDVQQIPSLKEQTVIVIRAPAETKLEVPHPEESLQVHLSSTQGPIEAFLCSENSLPLGATGNYFHSSTNGKTSTPFVPYSPFVQVSSKDKDNRTSGLDNTSNTPSGPTLNSPAVSPVSPMQTSLQSQSFVTLTPPSAFSIDGGEYILSLNEEEEGITDLFSSFELDHSPMDVPIL